VYVKRSLFCPDVGLWRPEKVFGKQMYVLTVVTTTERCG
jgi:hypothetical protein